MNEIEVYSYLKVNDFEMFEIRSIDLYHYFE